MWGLLSRCPPSGKGKGEIEKGDGMEGGGGGKHRRHSRGGRRRQIIGQPFHHSDHSTLVECLMHHHYHSLGLWLFLCLSRSLSPCLSLCICLYLNPCLSPSLSFSPCPSLLLSLHSSLPLSMAGSLSLSLLWTPLSLSHSLLCVYITRSLSLASPLSLPPTESPPPRTTQALFPLLLIPSLFLSPSPIPSSTIELHAQTPRPAHGPPMLRSKSSSFISRARPRIPWSRR